MLRNRFSKESLKGRNLLMKLKDSSVLTVLDRKSNWVNQASYDQGHFWHFLESGVNGYPCIQIWKENSNQEITETLKGKEYDPICIQEEDWVNMAKNPSIHLFEHVQGFGSDVQLEKWRYELWSAEKYLSAITDSPQTKEFLTKLAHQKMQQVGSEMKNWINKDREQLLNISLFGKPKTGKSTLFHLLTQKTISNESNQIIKTRVNIDSLPVNLIDTISLDQSMESNQTFEALKKSDLKICLLDLGEIYSVKDSVQIPKHILENIDSDTLILLTNISKVKIYTPAPPLKMRFKNTPMSPTGDVFRTSMKGRIPLRTDEILSRPGEREKWEKEREILFGEYALKVNQDIRMTEKCLQDLRSNLHRYMKEWKGSRFWIRPVPNHPVARRPLGVRMGKGKSPFDHWEAKIPTGSIIFEIGGAGIIREDVAKKIVKRLRTRIPGKTEFLIAPKDETMESVKNRILNVCHVPPLGIWSVCLESGKGLNEFTDNLSKLIRNRYMIPEGNELNPTSKIYHHAQTALEHLSESNLTNAIQELESVIEKQNLHYASEYLFHSKYGVLNHNQLQTQALNELKTKEGFQVQLLDTVKPMLSVAL